MRYGREQELQSDEFGTKYMKLAGYDPVGAMTLQETFVRISNQKGGKQGFFDRMFASHPPSAERVEKNRLLAGQLGGGGEIGEDKYRSRLAALLKAKPAYDKYDQAAAALKKKEYGSAANLASEASKLLPTEGRFHELQGEIEIAQKRYKEALPHYERAIQYNPGYFGSYLGAGIAQYESGNKAKGQEWLKRSNALLPTQPAAYYLGKFAQDSGDRTAALQYFKAAAGAESTYGKLAAKEFVSMDLGQNPEQYVGTGTQLDGAGGVVVVVQNRSPVVLTNVRVTPVLVDASGRIVQTGSTLQVGKPLEPNQQIALNSGLRGLTAEQIQSLRVRVDGAQVAGD
jgi:predicted Zn-dependent protease